MGYSQHYNIYMIVDDRLVHLHDHRTSIWSRCLSIRSQHLLKFPKAPLSHDLMIDDHDQLRWIQTY